MAISYSQTPTEQTIEDTIADFLELANGLKCFFENSEHSRKKPYQTVNIDTNKRRGKPWKVQTFGGSATTQKKHPVDLLISVNIFLDLYDSKGKPIRESPKTYADFILNAINEPDLKTGLDAIGLKISSSRQVISDITFIEDDKFVKQSVLELGFKYVHTAQKVDSDVITQIDTPTLTVTE